MTAQEHISNIRAALKAHDSEHVPSAYRTEALWDACNPTAMVYLLAHIDQQAAEMKRLKAESEERLQNAAALVAENEQLRWAVKDALAQLQRGDFADAESTLSVTAMKETP